MKYLHTLLYIPLQKFISFISVVELSFLLPSYKENIYTVLTGGQGMKYFFTLLLIGFIHLNIPPVYGAETPGEKNTEQSQESPLPTQETKIANGQQPKPTEETTTAEQHSKPTEDSALDTLSPKTKSEDTKRSTFTLVESIDEHSKNESPPLTQELIYLEHTLIGRAIIEGNIEEYKAALTELTEVFNTSFSDILQKRTSNEDTLLELMIATEKNTEYFTSEMFYLLVFKMLSDQGLPAIIETQLLLDKANQVNNELAARLLSSLETLFNQYETDYKEMTAQHAEESISLREQIINLAKNQYSKTKIALNIGMATLGGALSVWGYKLFTHSSPNVVSPAPQIAELLSTVSGKEVAIGAMAVGAVVAASKIHKCGRTFMRRRQLNRQQRELNRERNRNTEPF